MLETLAHYKILERIGAGDMGEVYRGRDTRLGRTVAITILSDQLVRDPERRDRFLHYARAASALSHPNIAALYEIAEDQGRSFLVCEFVPGEPLAAVMDGRPINPRRAVDLGAQLADALAEGHAAGIVHGAINPAHVIVTPKGHAKILDFGLTMSSGADARSAAYLSPEQMSGEAVAHATDIFSLGVLLFEMVTGMLPAAQRNHALPAGLDPILRKAMALQPAHRYESAAMLAADLREVAATIARAAAERTPVPVASQRRQKRAHGRWLIVLLVIGVATAGWIFRQDVRAAWHSFVP
jgi:serine/threonine protein kinase